MHLLLHRTVCTALFCEFSDFWYQAKNVVKKSMELNFSVFAKVNLFCESFSLFIFGFTVFYILCTSILLCLNFSIYFHDFGEFVFQNSILTMIFVNWNWQLQWCVLYNNYFFERIFCDFSYRVVQRYVHRRKEAMTEKWKDLRNYPQFTDYLLSFRILRNSRFFN